MRTLQSKLMLWIGISIAAVLFVSGVVLYLLVHSALLTEFDLNLQQTCKSTAHLIETDGKRITSEMAEKELPRFARTENPDLYQIFDSEGRTIEASRALGDKTLRFFKSTMEKPRFEFLTLPDGRPGRVISFEFVPTYDSPGDHEGEADADFDVAAANDRSINATVGSPVTLLVARDTYEMNSALRRIRWLIGIVMAIAIAVGILLAAIVARLGLAPLRATAQQLNGIDGSNLAVRLDSKAMPGEVQPMVTALNDMLDRLKLAFERERQFSANVAHELRTPLAGLKSTMEVTVSQRREASEYEASLGKCLAICDQTQAVIENLFTLARVDAGQCQVYNETIDVACFCREAWQPFAGLSQRRGLKVAWDVDESIQVHSDPPKLDLVFRNVFDNAASYADSETQIDIHCRRDRANPMVTIEISNTASGLTPADMEHLFERFWRGDKSRSQTGQHSGLGLPLCRSLISLLGGQITATSNGNQRFTIEIHLPIQPVEVVDKRPVGCQN